MLYIRRIFSVLSLLAFGPIFAQEIAEPRFMEADVEYFMRRLCGEVEKLAGETQTPAAGMSSRVAVGFTVDTAGRVTKWRFLDRNGEGRDKMDVDPPTEQTRELVTRALGRLGDWTPAMRDGRPVDFDWRLTIRLPIEKIVRMQEAEPLFFLGEDPAESFHPWAKARIRYDSRFTSRGVEGQLHIRFYIEPDGRITIGDVVRAPDDRLAEEVIRVIRKSKGKWTPRKVRGVPQRTAYDYRVHYHGNID